MSLNEYHDLDEDNFPIFGTERKSCHFPLLSACLKTDVDVLLPLLYYACSDYTVDSLLDLAKSQSMDSQCVITLVRGRDLLKDEMNELVACLPGDTRGGDIYCPGTKSCRKAAHFTELEAFCNSSDLGDIRGEEIGEHLHRACDVCVMQIIKLIDDKRQIIWDELPSYFGLPCWEQLKDKLAKIR